MERTFNFGKIDYYKSGRYDNRVTVTIELQEKRKNQKSFSASAMVWNRNNSDVVMGGQCLDVIAPYINDPVYTEILRLWELYHLNDMHPECEHQAALGWVEKAAKKVPLYHWSLTLKAIKAQEAAKEAAIKALKAGETFTPSKDQSFIASLDYSITTHTPTLPEGIANLYEPKTSRRLGNTGHTETKLLGWLTEDEHPEGLLLKACPVCGYKYGQSWNYFPIPAEDEAIICKLLEGKACAG